MHKLVIILILIFFLTGCTGKTSFEFNIETKHDSSEEEIVERPIQTQPKIIIPPESLEETFVDAPQKVVNNETDYEIVDWPVPFAMQAPFSNWDMPYQEMCEEAALVLVSKYYQNKPLDKNIMDQELEVIRKWETEKWGLYTDSTAAEIKEMGEAIYNLNIEISDEVTIDNIKDNLRKNYLVLVPTAGRELNNPYFKQPGPLYHVLVLRGFTDNSFIANDVGIGKGEGYLYKFQTVINATHDLPVLDEGRIFRPYDEELSEELKQAEMLNGTPRILIVKGLL